MKKLLSVFCLVMMLSGSLSMAFAADAHVHQWDAWVKEEGRAYHSAKCELCGEEKSVKCSTVSLGFTRDSISVCAYCGTYPEGTFELVPGATAVPQGDKPAAQKGIFELRGREKPFSEHPEILYAFTFAFNKDGGLTSIKNKYTISFPLKAELPEKFTLTRIKVSSGDDSTPGGVEEINIDYTCENGTLSFTGQNPSLYVIRAAE